MIKREKTLILLPMHFLGGRLSKETKQTLAMFVYQPCQQRHLHYHWWETDQGSQRECFQGKLSQTGHFYLDFFGVWAWVRSQLIGQSCLKIERKWKNLVDCMTYLMQLCIWFFQAVWCRLQWNIYSSANLLTTHDTVQQSTLPYWSVIGWNIFCFKLLLNSY